MSPKTLIPRFLLPAHGPAWRGVRLPPSQSLVVVRVRAASKTATKATAAAAADNRAKTTVVLAKPERFNPPSHGARLRGNVLLRHYAPQLSPAERAAQKIRSYPGLLPPEGTLAHRVWTSRGLHVFITVGILATLGVSTFFLNYVHHSPFKDDVPPISDLWSRPLSFLAAWKDVIVMHEKDKSEKAVAHRMRHQDDLAKRKFYMKMHGIEPKDPVLMVFGKGEKMWPDREPATVPDADEPSKAADGAAGDQQPAQGKKKFGLL